VPNSPLTENGTRGHPQTHCKKSLCCKRFTMGIETIMQITSHHQFQSIVAAVVRSVISLTLSPASIQTPRWRAKFALAALFAIATHSALAHGPSQPLHQLFKIAK